MRCVHGSSRWAVLAAVLSAGCNTVLGIGNLAPPPDGAVSQPGPSDGGLADASPVDGAPLDAPPDCRVKASLGTIVATPSTALLDRRADGGATLLLLLNIDPTPDVLLLALFDNEGGHQVLHAPGTYPLTAADARDETCGICVPIIADVDLEEGTGVQLFFALGQGTLTVERADAAGMAARARNLTLRRVTISGGVTRDVNDGCAVTLDELRFDLPYETVASSEGGLAAPALRVAMQAGGRSLAPGAVASD